MTRYYLDHASTAPLRPQARDAILEVLERDVGDPGRMHQEGMTSRVLVEQARGEVAAFLGARSREVVFCSGATEAIAAVCHGAASRGSHQVVTAVEHSAVRLGAARAGEVTVVPVDETGRVDPGAVLAAITPHTAVVHVQLGNHETGTLQPVEEVVAGCRGRGVLVHVDAAQAAGHVQLDFHDLGADLLALSSPKLGGPPGAGALLVRRGLRLPPLLLGGDQERARRAGLENVLAIRGFGAACDAVDLDSEIGAQRALTDRIRALLDGLDGVRRFGHPEHHLPHLVCAGVDDVEPQAVLLGLDRAGIAAHSGSACASETLEPSPVLQAMGMDARHSLRLSVGWSSTDADVDALEQALPRVIGDLRSLRTG